MTETRLFGFVQLDIPGTLPLADGRYAIGVDDGERVLVIETLGAPPPPRRRRRRAREAEPNAPLPPVPLVRATSVRAHETFGTESEATGWLESAAASEDSLDALLSEALALLNRALHAHAVSSGDPSQRVLTAGDLLLARIGYGSGEQVAAGEFAAAREIDPQTGASGKQRRTEELRPQERLAAVLRNREQLDPCEPLILRARADLEAARHREAALQVRIALEALLTEFTDSPADPGHDEDIATLEASQNEARELANAALHRKLDDTQARRTRELIEVCDRVLRRRRVLRG